MILFIAEGFSERQHLVSVRPCFHPIQQLDRALQHREITQFAKVTQRARDSFQIRPQESLAPQMPRISHMTSGAVNTFYPLQVDSSVLIFYLCLYFQGPKDSFFLTCVQWAHQIVSWFPVNSLPPSTIWDERAHGRRSQNPSYSVPLPPGRGRQRSRG